MTVEWRKPTVEELHAWLQCRPRVGKLLWRKTVKRSKTAWHQPYKNREKVWSNNGERSERGIWQKTVSGKLQADATPYPAGSSAIIKDRYAELIVIMRIPTKSPRRTDMKSPVDSETMSPTFPI